MVVARPNLAQMDALSYFALAVLVLVVLILAYGMIAIHDIPYLIARKRNHPHQDAIHAGGWVSLFTLHAIWPFLWLWAYSYHPEHGYAGKPRDSAAKPAPDKTPPPPETAALERRIAELEAELAQSKTPKSK
jgi:hypothetical protein